jgi:hypothetical protein
MANCAESYGEKRDKTLLYEQKGSVTLKPFSLHPRWWLWSSCIPRLVCSQGQCEEFVVVPRDKAVVTHWAETEDGMPYTVVDEPCYVLSVVIETQTLPLTLSVCYLDGAPIGRYTKVANGAVVYTGKSKGRALTFSVTEPSLILLSFLSSHVPVYCCIRIKRKEKLLKRSRKAIQGGFEFIQ